MENENRDKVNRGEYGLFRKLLNFFSPSQKTHIPTWLKERKRGENIIKSNAATKVIKFAGMVNLSQPKLKEIYHIECAYEEEKLKAMDEFPHVPKVMNTVINEARSRKTAKMESQLTKSQFKIYSQLFRKPKLHY